MPKHSLVVLAYLLAHSILALCLESNRPNFLVNPAVVNS